jgi:hypothetical protein
MMSNVWPGGSGEPTSVAAPVCRLRVANCALPGLKGLVIVYGTNPPRRTKCQGKRTRSDRADDRDRMGFQAKGRQFVVAIVDRVEQVWLHGRSRWGEHEQEQSHTCENGNDS